MEILLNALPTILTTIILAIVAKMRGTISDLNKQQKANINATFVMLQDRILHCCKQYQSAGFIQSHDAEMLQRLFEQYKAMHGNGYVATQVEITLKLPQEL